MLKCNSIKNILFVHIPKTGGKFVREALGLNYTDPLLWHYTLKNAINPRQKEIKIKNKFAFSVVRNPWERLVSTYFFCMKKHKQDPIILKRNYFSFDSWVMSLKKEYKNYFPVDCEITDDNKPELSDYFWLAPQYDWLHTPDGNRIVDLIGKLENVNNFIFYISKKLNIKNKIIDNKINSTDRLHYSKYYSEHTKEIVYNWYKKDIENFNYFFD